CRVPACAATWVAARSVSDRTARNRTGRGTTRPPSARERRRCGAGIGWRLKGVGPAYGVERADGATISVASLNVKRPLGDALTSRAPFCTLRDTVPVA